MDNNIIDTIRLNIYLNYDRRLDSPYFGKLISSTRLKTLINFSYFYSWNFSFNIFQR